jgi:lysophospholipase L1-like esterase
MPQDHMQSPRQEWCKHFVAPLLKQLHKPTTANPGKGIQLMVLFLGANDAVIPPHNTHQHVALERYTANLRDIITSVHAKLGAATRILLITPPPIEPEEYTASNLAKGREARDRSLLNTWSYQQAALGVASEHADYVSVVDTWPLFLGPHFAHPHISLLSWVEHPGSLFSDGLHLGRRGNELLAAAILQNICISWPELDPNNMDSKIPWWDKVVPTQVPDCLFTACGREPVAARDEL